MTAQMLMFLMLALGMCVLFSALAGIIGFGVALLVKAPVDRAISWGTIVAFSVMTLCIALLAVVVPLAT